MHELMKIDENWCFSVRFTNLFSSFQRSELCAVEPESSLGLYQT